MTDELLEHWQINRGMCMTHGAERVEVKRKVRRTWGSQSFELGPPSLQKAKNEHEKPCKTKGKRGKTEEKTKLLAPTVLGRWAFWLLWAWSLHL